MIKKIILFLVCCFLFLDLLPVNAEKLQKESVIKADSIPQGTVEKQESYIIHEKGVSIGVIKNNNGSMKNVTRHHNLNNFTIINDGNKTIYKKK